MKVSMKSYEKKDKSMDKKMGIKEGSKKDLKMDKKMPVMDKKLNRNIGKDMTPKVMSKSAAAKKAVAGKDMGKPGKNFAKIAAKAGKKYGSVTAGKKVAGAIFQKIRKAGKL